MKTENASQDKSYHFFKTKYSQPNLSLENQPTQTFTKHIFDGKKHFLRLAIIFNSQTVYTYVKLIIANKIKVFMVCTL